MDALIAKSFKFSDFELDGPRRLLRKQGETVALHSKTFDLLSALLERHGEVVSKDELLEKVWPGQFVEEGNLTVQISALRKLLGERKDAHEFVVTVPGRGYSFVADVEDGANGEVVIESHKFSRTIIEETVDEGSAQATIPATLSTRSHTGFVPGIAILLAAAATVATAVYLYSRSRVENAAVPFQNSDIKRLTNTGNITHARLSPDGKLFAYATLENGLRALWLGHVNGGEAKQLRPYVEERYYSLKFSSDANRLYYTAATSDGSAALYRIPVFGGAVEMIRRGIRGSFNISPDEKEVAFFRVNKETGEKTLSAIEIDGERERVLAVAPTKLGFVMHNPSWSPDGKLIALGAPTSDNGSAYEVFLCDASGGTITPLTHADWSDVGSTTWLKGGDGLVVVATERNAVRPQLWHVSYPDGEVRQILSDLSLYATTISGADDGKSLLAVQRQTQSNIWVGPADDIARSTQVTFGSIGRSDGFDGLAWASDDLIFYTARDDKGVSIWSMTSEGKNQRQVVPGGGVNDFPTISADGKMLVFESNRSGHFAVWRADADGTNMRQVTGDEVAGQPAISPDGKWIVYNSSRDEPGILRRIPAEGGVPLQLTQGNTIWPRFSPDGRFIACGYIADDKKHVEVFSIDGGEPLQRFDVPRLADFVFGVNWTADGSALVYRDWANGLWLQPIAGGKPQRVKGLPEERPWGFGWSRNGKLFASARGTQITDVVLISNSPEGR